MDIPYSNQYKYISSIPLDEVKHYYSIDSTHHMADQKFIKSITNKTNFFFYTLKNLPSLTFWGVKLEALSEDSCTVATKYSFRNTNPFKSMYFAALCGSGELATGLLVMAHVSDRGKWSMLVTSFQANFFKKATGKIRFHCNEGARLSEKLTEIEQSAESTGTIVLKCNAINQEGIEVAAFEVTWSLKVK